MLRELITGSSELSFQSGTAVTVSLAGYINRSFVFNSSVYSVLRFTPNTAIYFCIEVYKNGELVKRSSQRATIGGLDFDISGGDTCICGTVNNSNGLANNSTIVIS